MKMPVLAAIALMMSGAAALADNLPDLKGMWSGQWRTVIFGNNEHHPGRQTPAEAPRVRDITFTFHIEGQDGGLIWGKSWSDPARPEPFAAIVTADGRTIIGSDMDGSLSMSIAGADRLTGCYTHTALGPSKSIVASCGAIQRSR